MTYSAFPNTFHNDKWLLTFSNIPNVDIDDLKYFQSYIKSLSLPDYGIDNIASVGPFGFQMNHPVAGMKRNTNLAQLQIEFKVSEDFKNYIYMFNLIQEMRYGEINSDGAIRKYTIKKGILQMFDNQKRTVSNIIFTELMLLNISSLQLVMGESDEVTFICNFQYEEILYNLSDPYSGGVTPTQPESILPCGVSGIPHESVTVNWEV